jgi:hypothetical protein
MAHLDFKITSWKRIYIPDEKIDIVVDLLKKGNVDTPYDLLKEEGIYLDGTGPDEECEEPLTIEENNGASTQELFNNKGVIIYRNGDE